MEISSNLLRKLKIERVMHIDTVEYALPGEENTYA